MFLNRPAKKLFANFVSQDKREIGEDDAERIEANKEFTKAVF